jgi:GT2 family glycosyltransferase
VGFAKANNQAIREKVTQPYIWLLNSDTETGTQSLEQLYQYIISHPQVGALSPQLVYPTRAYQSVGGYFPSISNIFFYLIPITVLFPKILRYKMKSIALFPQRIPSSGLSLDYVTGAASLLRKQTLDQVGLLAEDYFMYFEETDLCFRLRKAGWQCMAIDTNPVMHVYGGSFKTKYDSRRLSIFLQSLRIFIKKNYTGFVKYIMLCEIFCLWRVSLLIRRLKNII